MRDILFASVAAFGLAVTLPALAQTAAPMSPPGAPMTDNGARPGNVPGTGNSLPTSNRSSNIDRADTRSTIAPRLPTPGIGESASPSEFLNVAKAALQRNRTGEAQEALERAETRMLDRSTPQGADPLSVNPMVAQIGEARRALASGDRARAVQIIDSVLASAAAMPPARM